MWIWPNISRKVTKLPTPQITSSRAVPHAPVGAQDQHRQHGDDGEQRPPLLLVGEGAEEDVAVLLADQRPAGAAAAAVAGRSAPSRSAVNTAQFEEPRQEPADGDDQHHRGDAVAPAREQVRAHPAQRAGVVDGRGELPAFAGGQCASVMLSAPPARCAVVPVHERRDRQADRQIDGHDQHDALDRLAGLVDRGVDRAPGRDSRWRRRASCSW